MTSYYVEKEGFIVIAGFIRNGPSGVILSFDTTHFYIEGKEGNWLAFDSIIIDGRQFFLMEHEAYGKEAAWVVLDEGGKLIVDNVYRGFDQTVLQQIKVYLNPPQNVTEPQVQNLPSGNSKEKQLLENWQGSRNFSFFYPPSDYQGEGYPGRDCGDYHLFLI